MKAHKRNMESDRRKLSTVRKEIEAMKGMGLVKAQLKEIHALEKSEADAEIYMGECEKTLQCPKCDKIMIDPRLLACGDTFCGPCLEQWRQETHTMAHPSMHGPESPVEAFELGAVNCPNWECARPILTPPIQNQDILELVHDLAVRRNYRLPPKPAFSWPVAHKVMKEVGASMFGAPIRKGL
ncbi:hypothetical protein AAF712_012024 [Marasmius tenuissimus]|uniref:C2H2-type domain-containing protein n=1 Tax=Marasmius tenuissimus TaxID=585030 RepID=A0ABR2ZJL0_9AGAR